MPHAALGLLFGVDRSTITRRRVSRSGCGAV
ncbi:hypothetical protein ACWCW2_42580 [Streptomyces sp. NPDC001773]